MATRHSPCHLPTLAILGQTPLVPSLLFYLIQGCSAKNPALGSWQQPGLQIPSLTHPFTRPVSPHYNKARPVFPCPTSTGETLGLGSRWKKPTRTGQVASVVPGEL